MASKQPRTTISQHHPNSRPLHSVTKRRHRAQHHTRQLSPSRFLATADRTPPTSTHNGTASFSTNSHTKPRYTAATHAYIRISTPSRLTNLTTCLKRLPYRCTASKSASFTHISFFHAKPSQSETQSTTSHFDSIQVSPHHTAFSEKLESRNASIELYNATPVEHFGREISIAGIMYPSNRLHPNQDGYFDYGPTASLLKENIKRVWHDEFVTKSHGTYFIESPTLAHPTSLTAPIIQHASARLHAQCKQCGQSPNMEEILSIEKNQEELQFDPNEVIEKDSYDSWLAKFRMRFNRVKDHIICPCCTSNDPGSNASLINLSTTHNPKLPWFATSERDDQSLSEKDTTLTQTGEKTLRKPISFVKRRLLKGFKDAFLFSPYIPYLNLSNTQQGFFRVNTLTSAMENLTVPGIALNSFLPLTIAQQSVVVRNEFLIDRTPHTLKENDVVSLTTFCAEEDLSVTVEKTASTIFSFCHNRLGLRQYNNPPITEHPSDDYVMAKCNDDIQIYNDTYSLKPDLLNPIIKTTTPFSPSYQLNLNYFSGFKRGPVGNIEVYLQSLYEYYYGKETMLHVKSKENITPSQNSLFSTKNDKEYDDYASAYNEESNNEVPVLDISKLAKIQIPSHIQSGPNNQAVTSQIIPYTVHSTLSLDSLTIATLYTHLKQQRFRVHSQEFLNEETGVFTPAITREHRRVFLDLPYHLAPYHVMLQTPIYDTVNVTQDNLELAFFERLSSISRVLWLPRFQNKQIGHKIADNHGILYTITYNPLHNVCEVRDRNTMKLAALSPDEIITRLTHGLALVTTRY